jgi:hypothetical protein
MAEKHIDSRTKGFRIFLFALTFVFTFQHASVGEALKGNMPNAKIVETNIPIEFRGYFIVDGTPILNF